MFLYHLNYFRLGGSEPLDYIPMFLNSGKPAESVPEHWHYVRY